MREAKKSFSPRGEKMETQLTTKLNPRFVQQNMKELTATEVIALFDEYKRGEWEFGNWVGRK